VVYICGCIPAVIQEALANLPETLDGTYERTLREITGPHREFAQRLFQFVAVASRPLRVEELAELLAFDFKAVPIPKFHESWRMKNPVDAVLSTCSSLLTIIDGGSLSETVNDETPSEAVGGSHSRSGSDFDFKLYNRIPSNAYEDEFFPEGADDGYRSGKVIQFSHYSVKEFLTSPRLAGATDITTRSYHISVTPSHTLAAQACLGILLHEDLVTSDSLATRKWPLAEYAARHWVSHAQFEDVSQNVEDGMKQLFDPSKTHLTICFRINQYASSLPRTRQDESPSTPRGTPLHYAALWGFDSIVEFLINKHSQDVNSQSFADAMTPLHLALLRGHAKIACTLINRGANVTAQDESDVTPLHVVSNTGPVEIARRLIERGADVTAHSNVGGTPLHVASARGQVEIARMLIERSADLTAENVDGETPLHLASKHGRVEVACMLIKRGADVTAQDGDGDTPLHLASVMGHVEVFCILIECGADVTSKNGAGKTPLHLASETGQVEVTRMLIQRGADVTVNNEVGDTLLHLASEEGQVKTARTLIAGGVDVKAKNKIGDTPLHRASEKGRVKVTRMLIELGADVTAKSDVGNTPLHLAS
jgi:ankyrin repeat protein